MEILKRIIRGRSKNILPTLCFWGTMLSSCRSVYWLYSPFHWESFYILCLWTWPILFVPCTISLRFDNCEVFIEGYNCKVSILIVYRLLQRLCVPYRLHKNMQEQSLGLCSQMPTMYYCANWTYPKELWYVKYDWKRSRTVTRNVLDSSLRFQLKIMMVEIDKRKCVCVCSFFSGLSIIYFVHNIFMNDSEGHSLIGTHNTSWYNCYLVLIFLV